MSHIIYEGERIEVKQGQTVLSALLERGYSIANSCRAGVCQSCLMQATDGKIPEASQAGLKDTLKSQGYFMACSCQPDSPLHIAASNADDLRQTLEVIDRQMFNNEILRLRLKPQQTFDYQAGQYLTVWKDNTTARSYSLASLAQVDELLELHIRRIPNGEVSNWLHDEIAVGDTLPVLAATGDCFYIPGAPEQVLILAGTGTGLAPLIGIARDALQQGHPSDIHLIHGALRVEDLYMHQTLLDMTKQYKQFHYHCSVLQVDNPQVTVSSVPLDQQVLARAADQPDAKIYLCGDSDMINSLKRKLFIAGTSINNIYTDAFVSSHLGQGTSD